MVVTVNVNGVILVGIPHLGSVVPHVEGGARPASALTPPAEFIQRHLHPGINHRDCADER